MDLRDKRIDQYTDREFQAYLAEIRAFTSQLAKSPEKSRQFLYDAGICDKRGRLRDVYR